MDAECPRPRSEFPLSPFSLEPSIDGAVPKRQVGVQPGDFRGARRVRQAGGQAGLGGQKIPRQQVVLSGVGM